MGEMTEFLPMMTSDQRNIFNQINYVATNAVGSHLKPQQTYEHKNHIEISPEMRHFNWQRYNRPGIKDILNMNDYVDLVVGKIDRYNAGEYEDSWTRKRSLEIFHFCDYLLVAIGDATWKDVEAFQMMTKRVRDLEISGNSEKKLHHQRTYQTI